MTAKEYLQSDECAITHVVIAKMMFPTNKDAHSYFSRKLNGKNGRSWTQKDEDLALSILWKLGTELNFLK